MENINKKIKENLYSFHKVMSLTVFKNIEPYEIHTRLGRLFQTEINRKLDRQLNRGVLFILQEKTIVSDEEYE